MNKGIEILLARMESNPDEFMGINNKWVNLMDSYEEHMVEEDRKALYAKYSALHMDKFTEHVMKKLLEEQGDRKAEIYMYAQQVRSKLQNMAAQQAQQQYYNNAQNQPTGISSLSLGTVTVPSSAYAHATSSSPISIQDSNKVASEIRVGKQTLTEKTLKKLKVLVK